MRVEYAHRKGYIVRLIHVSGTAVSYSPKIVSTLAILKSFDEEFTVFVESEKSGKRMFIPLFNLDLTDNAVRRLNP